MELSLRQKNILNTWLNDTKHIVINAVAGSGKTTMLLELLKYCKYKTLIVSFNNSIQKEFQEKIDSKGLKQGLAKTLHSIGLSAIRNTYKVNINKNKNFELIKELQGYQKDIFKGLKWEDKLKVSYTLMDMNDVSRLFLTDKFDEIVNYMKSMDKSYHSIREIRYLWNEFVKLRNKSYEKRIIDIDFHDMIYIPVVKNLNIPFNPYYLMIDEAQDLNIVQHKFIDNFISQGDIKRWIAVGDRNQSIYGFSGAYSSSFDLFKEKENTIELPLDICYRCPASVIKSANEVYNVMQPFKKDLGKISFLTDFTQVKSNSLIICRNTSALIDLYFLLLGDNRKAFLKGEDIISSVTKFLKPYNYKTISEATLIMSKEEFKLLDRKDDNETQAIKYYVFKENYKNFLLLSKNLCDSYNTVEDLLKKFTALFSTEGEGITLCTIHKSKGLEADIVYILNEDLIPSKFAKSQQQLKQEKNLKYVARTRAKKELHFLNL